VREIHKKTGEAMTMNVKSSSFTKEYKKGGAKEGQREERKKNRIREIMRWIDISSVLALPTSSG
jgi:hypothetical protein